MCLGLQPYICRIGSVTSNYFMLFWPRAISVLLFQNYVFLYFTSVLLRFLNYSFIVACFFVKPTILKTSCALATTVITNKGISQLPSSWVPPITCRCMHQGGDFCAFLCASHELLVTTAQLWCADLLIFVKLMKWLNTQNEEPVAWSRLLWVCALNSGGSFTGSVFFPGFLYLAQPLGLCFIHGWCGAWQTDTSFKMRFQHPDTGVCITVICSTSTSEKVWRIHMLENFSSTAPLCSYLILA